MKILKLTKNATCMVDDAVFKKYSHLSWYLGSSGYAMRREQPDGRNGRHINIRLHRIIIGAKDSEFVDHINGNKLDNRISNLRICTKAQNSMNRGLLINNTSGFRGISKKVLKNKEKWLARICYNSKEYYLGFFNTPQLAASAYNVAAKKYFGEFAYLNKI